MKSLRLAILMVMESIMLPISLFAFSIYLPFKCFSSFRRADVIILPEKMNFGATAFVPDMARRIYPEKDVVFTVFRELCHNPIFPEIWREVENIDYLNLSRCGISQVLLGRAMVLPNRKAFDPLAVKIVELLIGLVGRSPLVIRNRLDLYKHVDVPRSVREAITTALARAPGDPELEMYDSDAPYYTLFSLRDETWMRNPCLSRKRCDEVEGKLEKARNNKKNTRLCGLYIKRDSGNELHTRTAVELSRREGSEFKAYLPAVRFLVERGFQVLLTGDVAMPLDVAEEFCGMFVDGDVIGADPNVFKAYAALHTDIFIGDNGGGWSFAGLVAERSMLGLNNYPFSDADGKFWLYYKHVFDERGNQVPFCDMAQKYSFHNRRDGESLPEGFQILANSADEILDAVRFYVDEVECPGSSQLDPSLEDLWAAYSQFKISGSHISPAFVKNYHKKRALADVA